MFCISFEEGKTGKKKKNKQENRKASECWSALLIQSELMQFLDSKSVF